MRAIKCSIWDQTAYGWADIANGINWKSASPSHYIRICFMNENALKLTDLIWMFNPQLICWLAAEIISLAGANAMASTEVTKGKNDPIIIHLMTKMLSQWNVYTVHPEKVYAENIVTSKSCNVKLNGWCGSFGATNGSHRYAIIYLIMVITFRITIKTEWIPIHKSITWFDIEIFGKCNIKSKSIWLSHKTKWVYWNNQTTVFWKLFHI